MIRFGFPFWEHLKETTRSEKKQTALLPDIQQHQWGGRLAEIEGLYDDEAIANGGAAMTAWAYMQFAEMSETERNALDGMLR